MQNLSVQVNRIFWQEIKILQYTSLQLVLLSQSIRNFCFKTRPLQLGKPIQIYITHWNSPTTKNVHTQIQKLINLERLTSREYKNGAGSSWFAAFHKSSRIISVSLESCERKAHETHLLDGVSACGVRSPHLHMLVFSSLSHFCAKWRRKVAVCHLIISNFYPTFSA